MLLKALALGVKERGRIVADPFLLSQELGEGCRVCPAIYFEHWSICKPGATCLTHSPLRPTATTCHSQGRRLIFTIFHLVSLIFKDIHYKIKSYSTLPFYCSDKRHQLVVSVSQKENV